MLKSRPRNTSPCGCPKRIGPNTSLMPYSVTICRAIVVARSMSFCAPVVGSAKISSSAVRPPNSMASSSKSSLRVTRNLSSVGNVSVYPSARPRGMIEILCTGSVFGSVCATSV